MIDILRTDTDDIVEFISSAVVKWPKQSSARYVYYFIESLADAGVLAGLPREQAWQVVLENVEGAVAMLRHTKLHPRQLLDINNSPGGVGIHGLYELNNSDFAAGLQRSVLAAVKRTTELGKDRP